MLIARYSDKFKVYPLYDFACPIVDSVEGVTHALRSAEYISREPLYYWYARTVSMRISFFFFSRACNVTAGVSSKISMLAQRELTYSSGCLMHSASAKYLSRRSGTGKMGMERRRWRRAAVELYSLHYRSRVNFTHTVLSKRKLQWFVEEGRVDGWNSPAFPTVQGMCRSCYGVSRRCVSLTLFDGTGVLRRGLTKEAVNTFMLSMGASKRDVMMDMNKVRAGKRTQWPSPRLTP